MELQGGVKAMDGFHIQIPQDFGIGLFLGVLGFWAVFWGILGWFLGVLGWFLG